MSLKEKKRKYEFYKISTPQSVLALQPDCVTYRFGRCIVMVGTTPKGWHLSISHKSRNPYWHEIRDARYQFIPDTVTMAMLLPPKEEYINVAEHCFQMHEIPGEEDGQLSDA